MLCVCVGCSRASRAAEPEKQFDLLRRHIAALRRRIHWSLSKIIVYVERNLGFEAEHHEYALRGSDARLSFYEDPAARRVGVLTTAAVKHAMCTVTDSMLRERRIVVHADVVVTNGSLRDLLVCFREQMFTYSYSFKEAPNLFAATRCALTGKVGGCKDDLCICLQLAAYWTGLAMSGRSQAAALGV